MFFCNQLAERSESLKELYKFPMMMMMMMTMMMMMMISFTNYQSNLLVNYLDVN